MREGFTLIEVILVVAMITVVAGTGFFVLSAIVATDVRDTSAQTVMQGLRRARNAAVAMRHDDGWGVSLSSVSVTVFLGESFALRDNAYDESFAFPRTILVGGTQEIVFAKRSGLPVTAATMSITYEDESRFITINEAGAVTYQQ